MARTDEEKVVAKKPDVPAKIGAAVDALFKMREARRKKVRAGEQAKADEKAYHEEMIRKFKKDELEGARGKKAQATIERREVPNIEDYDSLRKHLQKHPEDIDVLQRRLSGEAVKERWAAGVALPGVGKYVDLRIRLTQTKKKR